MIYAYRDNNNELVYMSDVLLVDELTEEHARLAGCGSVDELVEKVREKLREEFPYCADDDGDLEVVMADLLRDDPNVITIQPGELEDLDIKVEETSVCQQEHDELFYMMDWGEVCCVHEVSVTPEDYFPESDLPEVEFDNPIEIGNLRVVYRPYEDAPGGYVDVEDISLERDLRAVLEFTGADRVALVAPYPGEDGTHDVLAVVGEGITGVCEPDDSWVTPPPGEVKGHFQVDKSRQQCPPPEV